VVDIPIIKLDQTEPLKRGEAYGESVRTKIEKILGVYSEALGVRTGDTWDKILRHGDVYQTHAREFAPALIQEVEGIARGSGRSFDEIFLLNARSEILFGTKALGLECTSILALPGATVQGQTLLAQNWDWIADVEDCQVILEIRASVSTPPLVTFTEAGQVAKLGLNGAGIALVVNNLTSDSPRQGVPWIFIARRVLESTHLTEAIGQLLSTSRAHSINFLLAHAGGEGVNLETAPVEEHVQWPEQGLLIHTNHFLQPCSRFRDLKPIRDPHPSTYLRYRRASHVLGAKIGCIDEELLKKVLSDHFDKPFSVCAHPTPGQDPLDRMKTCLSVVINLTKMKVHFCPGNPCQGKWNSIDLEKLGADWR
jgi:isopenicillin-N N-acyltransferase-like protein